MRKKLKMSKQKGQVTQIKKSKEEYVVDIYLLFNYIIIYKTKTNVFKKVSNLPQKIN